MKLHPPRYPRTPHWPGSGTAGAGERIVQRPEDFINNPIVITEKIDGANTRLFDGEALPRGGSRTVPWLAMARKHHAWKLAGHPESGCIYAEDIYGVHSITYGPVPEDRTTMAFALLQCHQTGPRFATQEQLQETCAALNIPLVPVVYQGTVSSLTEMHQLITKEMTRPSALQGPREGLVIRRNITFAPEQLHRHTCKFVRPNHVQTDQHWSRNWQPCHTLSPSTETRR